jgi:polyhydroxybutyrate depolymerase
MSMRRWPVLLTIVLTGWATVLAGCGQGAGTTGSGPRPSSAAVGGSRPVQVTTPPGYRQGTPAPLLLVLHGYGDTPGAVHEYLGLGPVAGNAGMLYATPSGTRDSAGDLFWNATDACCDTKGSGVDDSAYLSGVIADIRRQYTLDDRRIYVMGVSNGGFMAHRLACDHADVVAAVVSAAGAGLPDDDCRPSRPVTVLQIHGDADSVIRYAGATKEDAGFLGAGYPGAEETVRGWARRNGCTEPARDGAPVDLAVAADVNRPGSRALEGAETRTRTYDAGCRPGGVVQLWTIAGADHAPDLSASYAQQLVAFLLAHPKPPTASATA